MKGIIVTSVFWKAKDLVVVLTHCLLWLAIASFPGFDVAIPMSLLASMKGIIVASHQLCVVVTTTVPRHSVNSQTQHTMNTAHTSDGVHIGMYVQACMYTMYMCM